MSFYLGLITYLVHIFIKKMSSWVIQFFLVSHWF